MSHRPSSPQFRLRDILPYSGFGGGGEIRISSCTSDPRKCRRGGLFVALQTPEYDGHELVVEAVQRGAAAVVAERQLPIDAPQFIVPDSREAYGFICHRLADTPSRHLRTIGITGTNGKTTTSLLIAAVLRAAGHRTGMLNSLAYDDSNESKPAPHATLTVPELVRWLSRMRLTGCSHAVLESSSRALAQRSAAGLELDAAVLTNVRRDHLDYHGSIFNYRRAKGRLFELLKPGGFAVANADDPASRFLLRNVHHPVLTFGLHMPAELMATVVERHAGEQTFLLSAGSETAAVQTAMIGDHHVYNCLAAAAVGLTLGIDLTTITRGLESVTQIAGRMESIVCGQPFGVYVDDAHTPDALAVVLKTLRQVTAGRVFCVFGADAARDPSQRPLLGRVVERTAHQGIITNDNPRREQPLQIAHDIIDGYDRAAKAHIIPDRGEAIRWTLGQAQPGDAVLIAGKGHRQTQIVGGQSRAFDDREVARQWLREVGATIDYQQPQPAKILRFACGAPTAN